MDMWKTLPKDKTLCFFFELCLELHKSSTHGRFLANILNHVLASPVNAEL